MAGGRGRPVTLGEEDQLGTIVVGYDVESAAVGEGLARFIGPNVPQYYPALDPESTAKGLDVLARVHDDIGVPGTLFVCGRTLLHAFDAVRAGHDSGLFDIQQHTYSHLPFKDIYYSPRPGTEAVIAASPPIALREELAFTSSLIERHFGHPCVGIRTPFGYHRGLRDRPDLLGVLRDVGIRYVTSWGRNEENENPTPWDVQPFTYADEGFDDVLEIPFQFWLDAIWFDRHGWDQGAAFRRALEGAVDEVAANDLVYGVCFHDWVMLAADEERTGWVRGFLSYAKERVEVLTYTDYWRRVMD